MYCLGCGATYPIALEGALKLIEVTYVHCEGMLSTEFKHGPLSAVRKGFLITFCAGPNDVPLIISVLKGRYKVRIGDETFYCDPGGFAYLPSKVPHAFLNLTDEPGEIIVVYTPGGGHKFYEEFGPISRNGPPDPKVLGPLFEKYGMTLLGKPLSADE